MSIYAPSPSERWRRSENVASQVSFPFPRSRRLVGGYVASTAPPFFFFLTSFLFYSQGLVFVGVGHSVSSGARVCPSLRSSALASLFRLGCGSLALGGNGGLTGV